MYETMFVRPKAGTTTLDVAASRIFQLLGLETTEERESSNFVDGHYFVGHGANASVDICLSDGATMPEYPFWVTIKSPRAWVSRVTQNISTDPSVIAAMLAKGGWEIFVPIGKWSRKDWDGKGMAYAA